MFKYFVLISSLLLAGTAAWFSTFGISQLFIAALIPATIMAIALEIGKVVSVSYLYRYWSEIGRFFKIYLFFGSIALSLITSVGVYSYLSVAYSTNASQFSVGQNALNLLTTQVSAVDEEIQLGASQITKLQQYRVQQENRLDSLVGKQGFITQQRIISESSNEIKQLRSNISNLNNRKDSLNVLLIQRQSSLYSNSKIGTFWYIAQVLNTPLDKLVHLFILLIVVVFDPMALSLIIAYNSIVKKSHGSNVSISTVISSPSIVEDINLTNNEESSGLPYYAHPDYDWNNDSRWQSDSAAQMFRQRAQRM